MGEKNTFWVRIELKSEGREGHSLPEYVQTASLGQNSIFTHPIFESDFDCLTGKYRILALPLLPLLPLIIQKYLEKILYRMLHTVWVILVDFYVIS